MRYSTPAGLSDIAVEFDPEETWRLACGLVRECLEEAGLRGGRCGGGDARPARGADLCCWMGRAGRCTRGRTGT